MEISPLAKKLQVKPNHRLAVLHAPEGYLARMDPLPEGAHLVEGPAEELDFVQLFVKNLDELERLGPLAFGKAKYDGLLWVCYPKGGAKAGTDLNRDILWQRVKPQGLEGVALVALDDTWSAMRFRPKDRVGK